MFAWLLGQSLFPSPTYVSDAWALLRKSHTESEDMVTHFLQACQGVNLGAEAVKYIPEGCNRREDCRGVEVTIFQLKNKGYFSEMAPCPLSATLYQNQTERTMCSEELDKLVKRAVTEVRKPHPSIRWKRRKGIHTRRETRSCNYQNVLLSFREERGPVRQLSGDFRRSDNPASSYVFGPSYAYSLGNFIDISARQHMTNRQKEKSLWVGEGRLHNKDPRGAEEHSPGKANE
ncbi:uncharacterized protein LOC124884995 isoform X4 [Girardinichthys multiradiatus]|uniref:uncharacterized protein LOC124884995 isoform X4 n=1 Tax=Girardinichthys multiradiatus TaxID=208333 RepID=UPI001FABBCE2|nr:uncharacterized protein LOC124884995 isoform X4 [Girardinichthys multiradiatus]